MFFIEVLKGFQRRVDTSDKKMAQCLGDMCQKYEDIQRALGTVDTLLATLLSIQDDRTMQEPLFRTCATICFGLLVEDVN